VHLVSWRMEPSRASHHCASVFQITLWTPFRSVLVVPALLSALRRTLLRCASAPGNSTLALHLSLDSAASASRSLSPAPVQCGAVLCCAPLSCSSSSSSSSSSCLSAPAESYSQLGCRMYPSLADRQMRPKTLFQARPGQSSPIRLLSQTRSIGSQEHRGPALSLRGGVVPARSLSLTLAQRRSSRCLPSLRVPLRARERQVDGSAARFRFPPRIPAPTSNGFQEQVRPALCNSTETSTPIYRHRVSEMIMAAPAPRTLEKFSDSLLLLAALSRIRQ
jgi:hypothetical protein